MAAAQAIVTTELKTGATGSHETALTHAERLLAKSPGRAAEQANEIDVVISDCARAKPFGRRSVTVHVQKPPPQ